MPEATKHLIAARLKEARRRAQMKQSEAADVLDVSPSAISQYESGKRSVDGVTLDRLAQLYGVPVQFFFRGETKRTPGWERALRQRAKQLSAGGRKDISRLINKVRALEELFERTDMPFPGLPHPPFEALAERRYSIERVEERAEEVRRHFDLGMAPLLDIKELLESEDYLVFALPIGEEGEISGLFFNHPRLGRIVVANSSEAYTRRPFILSHELAHGLFHYDRPAILCRADDDRPSEWFADKFASHFLIPREALLRRIWHMGIEKVTTPGEVVHLARYFGAGFGTLIDRLKEEGRIVTSNEAFNEVRPVTLARNLGYKPSPQEYGERPWPVKDCLPRVFLELAYRAIKENMLSLRRVAEMLGISDIELEERLYAESPEPAEEYV